MNAATMSFRQLKAQTLNLILENKTTFCNHLAKSWTGFAKRILIFSPSSLKVMPVAARKVSGSAPFWSRDEGIPALSVHITTFNKHSQRFGFEVGPRINYHWGCEQLQNIILDIITILKGSNKTNSLNRADEFFSQ